MPVFHELLVRLGVVLELELHHLAQGLVAGHGGSVRGAARAFWCAMSTVTCGAMASPMRLATSSASVKWVPKVSTGVGGTQALGPAARVPFPGIVQMNPDSTS
jgi:hypothetical protein